MKIMAIFVCSVLFGVGLYMYFYSKGNYPSRKSKRVMQNSKRLVNTEKLMDKIEPTLVKVATLISPYVPLNALKEQEMENALIDADLPYSPKVFIARSVVIAVAIGMFAIPFFFLLPLGGFAVILLDVLVVTKEQTKVHEIAKNKRQTIEMELPRFAQHIALAIPNTSNVRGILETYRPMAGKTFGKELTKTIADIKTSDVQQSLLRMEQRVGSTMLSEIVRALCSVDNGIDQGQHFNMLAFNYRDKQNQLIRKEALRRPDKISTISMLGLVGIVVQVAVLLGTQLIGAFNIFNQ